MQPSPFFQSVQDELFSGRGLVRAICWIFFFVPYSVYLLRGSAQFLDLPLSFELGIATVSAALGGLFLSAGLNLRGPKRLETIRVAQKFMTVAVLMIIFLPTLHFVELMNGININSFQPDELEGWVRGFFFGIATISFYGGVSVFIIALVDLIYAMIGIGNVDYSEEERQGCACNGDQ